ncbi:MAG: copper chaperone PCu(A)C [Rhodanobacteraceae bacterium]
MKRKSMEYLAAVFALALATFISALESLPSPAHVNVQHGWIRWLPANLPAAGYATLRNDGNKSARLAGADSPDYAEAMLHRSMGTNGMDQMQMVDAIDIPAHGKIDLAPGGYHLMLMQPKHPIKPGDSVRVRWHLAGGETIQTSLPVRPANSD